MQKRSSLFRLNVPAIGVDGKSVWVLTACHLLLLAYPIVICNGI